jgi:hypothetical protein
VRVEEGVNKFNYPIQTVIVISYDPKICENAKENNNHIGLS